MPRGWSRMESRRIGVFSMEVKRIEMAYQVTDALKNYSLALILEMLCPYVGMPCCVVFAREAETKILTDNIQEDKIEQYLYGGVSGFKIVGSLSQVMDILKGVFQAGILIV